MGDDVRIGSISGSVFAVGRGNTVNGAVTSSADVDGLRRELATLDAVLARHSPSPQVIDARKRVEQLDEAVAENAEAPEVRRIWDKLTAVAAGLAVAANLAQIGSFIQPFLG